MCSFSFKCIVNVLYSNDALTYRRTTILTSPLIFVLCAEHRVFMKEGLKHRIRYYSHNNFENQLRKSNEPWRFDKKLYA